MFKEGDEIETPKGRGKIIKLQKSSYSRGILFYVVKLNATAEEYLCAVDAAKEVYLF